jgi:hypothetical protein
MLTRINTLVFILISSLFLVTGCSSDSPTTVDPEPVVVIDTAPPAVPTSLNATSADRWVKLLWDDNTVDSDFQGFNVYRRTASGDYLISDTLLQEPRFIDYYPLRRGSVYAVTAVDETGNESAWVTVNYVTPLHHDPLLGN